MESLSLTADFTISYRTDVITTDSASLIKSNSNKQLRYSFEFNLTNTGFN